MLNQIDKKKLVIVDDGYKIFNEYNRFVCGVDERNILNFS